MLVIFSFGFGVVIRLQCAIHAVRADPQTAPQYGNPDIDFGRFLFHLSPPVPPTRRVLCSTWCPAIHPPTHPCMLYLARMRIGCQLVLAI